MDRGSWIRSRLAFPTTLFALVTLGLPIALEAAPGAAAPKGTIVFAAGEVPPGGGIIERSIYTIEADGTGRTQLTEGYDAGAPSWSPDGERIVFTADPNGDFTYHLYVMNADGSDATQLTDSAENEIAPAWSPDGTRIAFTASLGGNYRLMTMAADGTDEQEVAVGGISASWSPEGTKLVFSDWDSNKLYTVNADGSDLKKLLGSGSNMGYEQGPAWSPDGKWIAFAGSGKGGQIFVVDPHGQNLKQVTSGGDLKMDPTWSTDGKRIAYTESYSALKTVKVNGDDGTTPIPSGSEDVSELDWYGESEGPDQEYPPECTIASDSWHFDGTSGDDVLCGGDSDNIIHGFNGNDTIYGGAGNDSLAGLGGDDYVYGEAGNDRIEGYGGKDHSYGGDGNDWFTDRDGQRDVIDGGPGKKDCAIADKKDVLKGVEIVFYKDLKQYDHYFEYCMK